MLCYLLELYIVIKTSLLIDILVSIIQAGVMLFLNQYFIALQ